MSTESPLIVTETLEEFCSHTETLRIGKGSCITLKILIPTKYKDWFFDSSVQEASEDSSVESGFDIIIQQILSLINPRLKKDLSELINKTNGTYTSQNNPNTFITDVSGFELPRFRLIPSGSSSFKSNLKFMSLKHHPFALYVVLHPSPSCIQKLVSLDPKFEFTSKDNPDESSYTITSQKIAVSLINRFKIG